MKVTVIPVVIGGTWNNPQRTGRLRNKRTSGDYQDYCIIKISQNTKKCTGALRRLTVIHTPMKNYQQTLE